MGLNFTSLFLNSQYVSGSPYYIVFIQIISRLQDVQDYISWSKKRKTKPFKTLYFNKNICPVFNYIITLIV